MRRGLCVALLAVAAPACARVLSERGHEDVAKLVEQRTGHKTHWEKGPPPGEQIARWVDDLLRGGLTRARAVEIALVNNPSLQITYEELGVSQADMVQAGLIANPRIGGSVGFPIRSQGDTEYEASLAQDFLSIFVMPLRKRIAREQFMADIVRVAHEAMRVAADVKKAMAAFGARARLVEMRRSIVDGAHATAELSMRQHEAGNIADLALTREQAVFEQARLDLEHDELALVEAREEVNRLLGLWGPRTAWRLAEQLAELPRDDPPVDRLESRAVAQRLDVDAARRQALLMWNALELARTSRYFGVIEVGVHVHQDADGPRLLGPTLSLQLPLFDQRQALIARLEAQHRQAMRRLDAIAISTRADVRVAAARLAAARRTVERFKQSVLPLRERAVEQTQLLYNAMQIGLFELIATKQAQLESYRDYIEAVRAYWAARADLELAVGGRLSPKGTP